MGRPLGPESSACLGNEHALFLFGDRSRLTFDGGGGGNGNSYQWPGRTAPSTLARNIYVLISTGL